MKRLGLLVAVEIDAVNELLGSPKWKKEEYGFPISCYELKGNELIVIHSNAGELAASEATSVLILEYGVKTIFNFGIVGALTHKIGDTPLVFVKEVVHSDADLSQIDHVPVGQHAGFDTPFIHLDEEYLNLASQVYPDIPLVRCASGDRFVSRKSSGLGFSLARWSLISSREERKNTMRISSVLPKLVFLFC